MGRGSRDEKRARRAAEHMATLHAQVRRGQRCDALAAIDTWLELDPAQRGEHFELVQRLVAHGLDELRGRVPNPTLTSWCARLERAPELVRGRDESEECERERWWVLFRGCLAGGLGVIARRLWTRLGPTTQDPDLHTLFAGWLERGELEGAAADAGARVLARLGSVDADALDERLGHEPPRRRVTLPPNASEDERRAFVETLMAQRFMALAELRQAARSGSPAQVQALWREAAPFILREALAHGRSEWLFGFAEALRGCPRPLTPELATLRDVALRSALSQLRALANADTKLFIELAKSALGTGCDAHIARALVDLGQDRFALRPELDALLAQLLTHADPVIDVWVFAASYLAPDAAEATTKTRAALEARLDAVVRTPRPLAAALRRLSKDHMHHAVGGVCAWFLPDAALRFVTALWPEAHDALRAELMAELVPLTERLDRARTVEGVSEAHELPPMVAEIVASMFADGYTVDDIIDQVAETMPSRLMPKFRSGIRAYAQRLELNPTSASRALWAHVGVDAVRYNPKLAAVALRHTGEHSAKNALVVAALQEPDIGHASDIGHDLIQLPELDYVVPAPAADVEDQVARFVLDVLAERFGDTQATWQSVYTQQAYCNCSYTREAGFRLMMAEARDGGRPSDVCAAVRKRYRADAKLVDTIYGPPVPAAKKSAARKPRARKGATP